MSLCRLQLRPRAPRPPPPRAPAQALSWSLDKKVSSWRSSGSEAEEAAEVEALAGILGGWLRYQAPIEPARIAELFELDAAAVERSLELLVRREQVVAGILTTGSTSTQVVSRSTFETLLRWKRAESRGGFDALPLSQLPLFVAWHQGLVERESGIEGLQRSLERLFGFIAPAGLWEREILPARIDAYATSTLDALFDESELVWFGAERERAAFAFRADLELFVERATSEREEGSGGVDPGLSAALLGALASSPRGADLATLADAVGRDGGEVSTGLWNLAWRGAVACDSMRALRLGVLAGFEPSAAVSPLAPTGTERPSRRTSFRRWQASRPYAGRWFAARGEAHDQLDTLDPLAAEERNAERVRLLLDRWGVLFRELLALELPVLAWSRLGRTLRRMELSGELVGGRFFEGIPGLQFAAPRTLARLRGGLPESALWWQNAADPSSLAGVALPGLKEVLPARRTTTHLVWRGSRPIAQLRRSGREIERLDRSADEAGAAAIEPLRMALTRSFDPERAIEVEAVDGEPAHRRSDLGLFEGFSVTQETTGLRLRRRWP